MSEQPGSLAAALVALQGRLPRITKDATADTGKFSYSYANLASITDTVLPILAELGLFWICKPTLQDPEDGGQFVLRYRLGHISGESETGDYPLPNSTPQTIGGAITYARRYAMCAVLGIAPAEDDDDAQAAEHDPEFRSKYPRPGDDASRGTDWQAPANPHTRKASRHRGTAGEDTAWNTPEAEDLPGSITDKQLQQIGILFGKLGIGSSQRSDRLALTMKYLDLPELASSKDLSMAQGSRLIQRLQQEAGQS